MAETSKQEGEAEIKRNKLKDNQVRKKSYDGGAPLIESDRQNNIERQMNKLMEEQENNRGNNG